MSTEYDALRRRILNALLNDSHGGRTQRWISQIADEIGASLVEVADQVDTLQAMGCVTRSGLATGGLDDAVLITPAGRRWAREGVSPESAAARVNVGNIIERMTGGTVQGIGSAPGATISQLAGDPAARRAEVEALTERLLAEVRDELRPDALLAYARAIEDLRCELATDEPEPSAVRRLLGTLAFLGDIVGTLGLTQRVWPYVAALLAIAAAQAGR